MTRVHYAAADVVTHGPTPWGEHEIDYLLCYKLDIEGEQLAMNRIRRRWATRWVTQQELFRLMDEKTEMPLWSPWFCLLRENS